MAKKSDLAVELSRLAEEATPDVLKAVLSRFWACGKCSMGKDAHPRKEPIDCRVWVPGFGMKDGLELLDRLTEFSLHEAKVEDALGLKKKEVGEQVSWLIGVDVAQFKRMTQVEREKLIEKRLEGKVLEAEVVPPGAVP